MNKIINPNITFLLLLASLISEFLSECVCTLIVNIKFSICCRSMEFVYCSVETIEMKTFA